MKSTDIADIRQAIQKSGLQEHAQKALDRVTVRISDLASFAHYAMDHSNDPAVVANAKRVLGIK
ncbi:MAG: hypothetical protein WCJ96_11460 [Verrucomicrobiota bacterium]